MYGTGLGFNLLHADLQSDTLLTALHGPGMFLSLQVVSVYGYNEPTTEYCLNMSSLPVHKKYGPHYHATLKPQ